MANAMRATYPEYDPAADAAYAPNKSGYYSKRSAAKGKPTLVTDANGNKKLVYVPWPPGEGPEAGAKEQSGFQPTYAPAGAPIGTFNPSALNAPAGASPVNPMGAVDPSIARSQPPVVPAGTIPQSQPGPNGTTLYPAPPAGTYDPLWQERANAATGIHRMNDKINAGYETAREKVDRALETGSAASVDAVNQPAMNDLIKYAAPRKAMDAHIQPLQKPGATGASLAFSGASPPDPHISQPNIAYRTPDGSVPVTKEQAESAEWSRKLDETRARAAEIRAKMAQTPRNMTRYDKDKNPTGRIVTTGKFREDGTEMLKDRVTGLPYYQSPGATPATTPVAEMRLPAPEVGSVGWSMDVGKKWSAQPEAAPQYQAPVDAAAAAQARFNKYMAGADERRLRKFETGSVKGTLASEAADQVAQRQAQFAGKQFDDTGKQLYSQLMGRLQGIQRAKLRPGQKSRALKQWMDEWDASGINQHVVEKPTPNELFSQTVTDDNGVRYGVETRNGETKLVKIAEPPKPAAAPKEKEAKPAQVGDVPFDSLPGPEQQKQVDAAYKELVEEAKLKNPLDPKTPTRAEARERARKGYAETFPHFAEQPAMSPPTAPATTVQVTPTEEAPAATAPATAAPTASLPPTSDALSQAMEVIRAYEQNPPGVLGRLFGSAADKAKIQNAYRTRDAELKRLGITPERADYLYRVDAARRFLAKAESLSPEARQDPTYLEQRKKALELVSNAS